MGSQSLVQFQVVLLGVILFLQYLPQTSSVRPLRPSYGGSFTSGSIGSSSFKPVPSLPFALDSIQPPAASGPGSGLLNFQPTLPSIPGVGDEEDDEQEFSEKDDAAIASATAASGSGATGNKGRPSKPKPDRPGVQMVGHSEVGANGPSSNGQTFMNGGFRPASKPNQNLLGPQAVQLIEQGEPDPNTSVLATLQPEAQQQQQQQYSESAYNNYQQQPQAQQPQQQAQSQYQQQLQAQQPQQQPQSQYQQSPQMSNFLSGNYQLPQSSSSPFGSGSFGGGLGLMGLGGFNHNPQLHPPSASAPPPVVPAAETTPNDQSDSYPDHHQTQPQSEGEFTQNHYSLVPMAYPPPTQSPTTTSTTTTTTTTTPRPTMTATTTTTQPPVPILPSILPPPPVFTACDMNFLDNYILNILNSVSYRKRLRPRTTYDRATLVKINAFIHKILEVNEYEKTWTVQMTLRQSWNDSRLQYNVGECHNYKFLTLSTADDIWTPDLYFPNEYEGLIHSVVQKNVLVKIYPNGGVIMSVRLTITMECAGGEGSRGEWFCTLPVSSFAYFNDEVNVRWEEKKAVQFLNQGVMRNNEFTIGGIDFEHDEFETLIGTYSRAVANFQFLRSQCFF